jgi:hypothetical protein
MNCVRVPTTQLDRRSAPRTSPPRAFQKSTLRPEKPGQREPEKMSTFPENERLMPENFRFVPEKNLKIQVPSSLLFAFSVTLSELGVPSSDLAHNLKKPAISTFPAVIPLKPSAIQTVPLCSALFRQKFFPPAPPQSVQLCSR